jgi:hypothetical protein
MTCWSCHRELAGHWRACPACGALSLANVEAVARGVASMAVRVRVRECRVNGCENVWRANTNGAAGHKRPTRHGAALAAFEAAWEASAERVAHPRPEPPPASMCRCVMSPDWTPGDIAEKLAPPGPDEDREPPSLWPRGIEAEGCPVITDPRRKRSRRAPRTAPGPLSAKDVYGFMSWMSRQVDLTPEQFDEMERLIAEEAPR